MQAALQGQCYNITEAALVEFLKFCHNNYDKPAFLGKLPGEFCPSL